MADFRYGPVELYLVGFEGDRPAPEVMDALTAQLDSGTVRLLDFVIVARSADGEVTVTEIDEDEYGFGDVELGAVGIAGEDDIDELAELIEPGASAALIALELVFARELASKLAASGGVVLSSERIPAPVVNAIVDVIENEEGE
ncbi:DUF6325 family protein [Microbacterium invictum]|uniref:Membrane protein n=1 Tax=Microbacterium invictum TaxID=515415 RepID=A0AA40SRC6_9MICO|nr:MULTISPECIES: DUF6325 family protein [Microbacterium]MBB4140904.1 putative membrane protein [Microbacterium invictum]